MPESDSSVLLLVVVALVAVLGLGLALASFATNESVTGMMSGNGGGPMMNRTTSAASAPGGLEWGILLVSAVFLILAVALLLRTRAVSDRSHSAGEPAVTALPGPLRGPPAAPVAGSEDSVPSAPSAPPAVPEPTLVKLLNEDERRMYLELRDHGGAMYQRDLVALGIFSKAKVTRVLDKLEAKGLVVREAHGMTNRLRLVPLPPK